MTTNRTVFRCILIAGILLMLMSGMHAFGLTGTLNMIKSGDISVNYAPTAIIIWVFGSITMLLTGATLVYTSKQLRMPAKGAWRLTMLIGLALCFFGGGFYMKYPGSPHMLGFLILGLLIITPLLIFAKQYK